jgi:hypothetical protein
MNSRSEALPREIEAEARELISELGSAGWTVAASEYNGNAFGNWYVDLSRGSRTLRLVKDRSQYMIGGPPTQGMKDVGLWKAFDSFGEFRRLISEWARLPEDHR